MCDDDPARTGALPNGMVATSPEGSPSSSGCEESSFVIGCTLVTVPQSSQGARGNALLNGACASAAPAMTTEVAATIFDAFMAGIVEGGVGSALWPLRAVSVKDLPVER